MIPPRKIRGGAHPPAPPPPPRSPPMLVPPPLWKSFRRRWPRRYAHVPCRIIFVWCCFYSLETDLIYHLLTKTMICTFCGMFAHFTSKLILCTFWRCHVCTFYATGCIIFQSLPRNKEIARYALSVQLPELSKASWEMKKMCVFIIRACFPSPVLNRKKKNNNS